MSLIYGENGVSFETPSRGVLTDTEWTPSESDTYPAPVGRGKNVVWGEWNSAGVAGVRPQSERRAGHHWHPKDFGGLMVRAALEGRGGLIFVLSEPLVRALSVFDRSIENDSFFLFCMRNGR